MKNLMLFAFAAAAFVTSAAQAQTTSGTYLGNGNTSFGGAVGNGSLSITNDVAGALNFTYTRGTGNFNDALVIYFDTTSGGATSTSGFTDQGDGLRKAISGVDGGNRSTLNFAPFFGADYALALNSGFAGLWNLSNASNFQFLTSANLSPTGNAQTAYTFNINASNIGLTANSGQTFSFFATYTSESAFRSVETVGASYDGSPSAGWNSFTAAGSNSFAIVPEPSSAALAALASMGVVAQVLRRGRKLRD
jgi:hypothetical protein